MKPEIKKVEKAEKKESLSLKSTYVSYALLHQAIHWPGTKLHSEKTFNKSKFPALKMEMVPQGLLLESDGLQCVVPYPNVASCVIE